MRNINKTIGLFFVAFILIISVQDTKAQQKPFKLGFKLSPAISWLSPDSKHYKSDGKDFSIAWGLIADITLMEHYYLGTGFNISYFKGSLSYPHQMTFNEINYEGTMNKTYKQRYIEVPLTIKMKTNQLKDNFLFFGLIGFNTGILLRAKADEDFSGTYGGTTKTYSDTQVDIKEESTLFKTSLVVGAGTEYVVDESVSIILGLNFNNGLTNVLKGDNTIYTDIEAKAIPYYFELNLGVIF